jgi:hypothetical protein
VTATLEQRPSLLLSMMTDSGHPATGATSVPLLPCSSSKEGKQYSADFVRLPHWRRSISSNAPWGMHMLVHI